MDPYRTIWLNPQRTFSELASSNRKQKVFALPILIVGLSFGLDMAPEISALLDEGFVWWSLLFTIPVGIGMAFLVIGLIVPWLVKVVGLIWSGSSTMRQMVNVYSLSLTPFLLLLLYQIILFAFGIDPSLDNLNTGLNYVIWLWSFGLLIIGVSKIQGFSYGIALLNIFISYLPLLVIGLMKS